MANALYICYFGLREPLVQTQVLPYLRELVKDGNDITLLTFEPKIVGGTDDSLPPRPSATPPNQGGEFLEEGIEWHWLPYHKWPSALATAYDIIRGTWFVRRIIAKKNIDILHGRVHIPTLMGAIARKLSRRTPKLLFDIRGFFPEEYTDAGVWPENGLLFRLAKRVERWLLNEADGFVVLTEKAREILFPDAVPQADGGWQTPNPGRPATHAGGSEMSVRPVEVIPCCVDLKKRFLADISGSVGDDVARLPLKSRFVLTHVGALGGLYLTENIADFLEVARQRRPETFALFLTQTDPSLIVPLLENKGFSPGDYFVQKVSPNDVPDFLRASDAALSFVKSSFSTQSRSPTKNAEYLACGVPVIANDGVGDTTEQITADNTGVIVNEFNQAAYEHALDQLDVLLADPEGLAARCRASAKSRFDLESVGGLRYRRLYSRLLGGAENL